MKPKLPPTSPDWRGLVIPAPMGPATIYSDRNPRIQNSSSDDFSLDDDILIPGLLYWDRILAPDSHDDQYNLRASEDKKALRDWGVLTWEIVERTHSRSELQRAAYQKGEDRDPGRWALACSSSASIREILSNEGRSLYVRLHDILPLPREKLPFQELMEFRYRRFDEACALRYHLDELYQGILAAGDGALMIRGTVDRISRAIADQMSAFEDSGIKFRLGGMEVRMKLAVDLRTTLIAGAATQLLMGEALVSTVVAAASNLVPQVEFGTRVGSLSNAADSTPYAYIFRLRSDLGETRPGLGTFGT